MKYFQPHDYDALLDYLPDWVHRVSQGDSGLAFDEVRTRGWDEITFLDCVETCAGSRIVTSPFDVSELDESLRRSLDSPEDDEFRSIVHPTLPFGLTIDKSGDDWQGYATLCLPVDGAWSDAYAEFDIESGDQGWFFQIKKVDL